MKDRKSWKQGQDMKTEQCSNVRTAHADHSITDKLHIHVWSRMSSRTTRDPAFGEGCGDSPFSSLRLYTIITGEAIWRSPRFLLFPALPPRLGQANAGLLYAYQNTPFPLCRRRSYFQAPCPITHPCKKNKTTSGLDSFLNLPALHLAGDTTA